MGGDGAVLSGEGEGYCGGLLREVLSSCDTLLFRRVGGRGRRPEAWMITRGKVLDLVPVREGKSADSVRRRGMSAAVVQRLGASRRERTTVRAEEEGKVEIGMGGKASRSSKRKQRVRFRWECVSCQFVSRIVLHERIADSGRCASRAHNVHCQTQGVVRHAGNKRASPVRRWFVARPGIARQVLSAQRFVRRRTSV